MLGKTALQSTSSAGLRLRQQAESQQTYHKLCAALAHPASHSAALMQLLQQHVAVQLSALLVLQAYELGNFPGIYHLRGGALGWSKAKMPFEGEYNAGGAGRTPNVVSNDDIREDERDAVDTIRNVQSD